MDKFFKINVNKYDSTCEFYVYKPASLNYPKDHAVMFVTERFLQYADALLRCKNSLVFWPQKALLPDAIRKRHAIYMCEAPRREYCRFFKDNSIIYLPEEMPYEMINGAYISLGVSIGKNTRILPGAYLGGGKISIGDNVYIGSGVRIVGKVRIGNNVVIRENAVIGADGLSTQRNEDGETMSTPQFGGVVIEDDVHIGALTVIARGDIDDTIIHKGVKIDNSCFISHNVEIGENTFVVGETIMFGSSSTGKQSYISGNATIRDGVRIGAYAKIGMGGVVTKDIGEGCIVKGNPAK